MYRLSNVLSLQSQNSKKTYLFLRQKQNALEECFPNLKSVFEINSNQTKGFIQSWKWKSEISYRSSEHGNGDASKHTMIRWTNSKKNDYSQFISWRDLHFIIEERIRIHQQNLRRKMTKKYIVTDLRKMI